MVFPRMQHAFLTLLEKKYGTSPIRYRTVTPLEMLLSSHQGTTPGAALPPSPTPERGWAVRDCTLSMSFALLGPAIVGFAPHRPTSVRSSDSFAPYPSSCVLPQTGAAVPFFRRRSMALVHHLSVLVMFIFSRFCSSTSFCFITFLRKEMTAFL